MRVQRALISVSDKRGVAELGQALAKLGVEILSTGGTAKLLREAGVKVRDVSEATGFPEMLGGRVKTLHPKIHGGILARRDDPEHLAALEKHGIQPIDLVVVNLYPFAQAAARAEATAEELIEEIDIGGPTLIRAAAKNCDAVAVVTSPDDYPMVIAELQQHHGVTLASRVNLARKAFALTASYDSLIARTLEEVQVEGEQVARHPAGGFPSFLAQPATKVMDLRYGENPHQRAALYRTNGAGVANGKQLQGKELSYNNLLDLDAAWDLASEFAEPVAVIIKHTNPAGVAVAATQHEAFEKALACDSVSAFGGILGFNQPVTAATAEAIGKLFLECIAAPGYEAGALEIFAKKKNLRLMEIRKAGPSTSLPAAGGVAPLGMTDFRVRSISGGLLVQDKDCARFDMTQFKTVTKRAPTAEELQSLLFAWVVCKHAKSNAIVYARDGQTVAVGAGQMSRVDSVKLGAMKARDLGHAERLKGSVVASDAFFPFPDGVEEAAKAGATAVIQPGGSVRDEEVIAAADRLGLAMVFTGTRHFRH
ncbi:MAG TPA: bifunctional phosphoribosylaminoimidazolecarboxamide formyltransferase/IMP cyclohydrolase [Candidatus Acidoferrales bacterium]|nr:bifunctional phosphoribosylaminoimidazolecarboxamide formyltransferase/IMP cyclohydrolase [Candidatus Acidoferrales bacterium]